MNVFKTVLTALFPNKCVSCGEIIDEEYTLCEYCFEMAKRVDLSKVCPRCGVKKSNCQCKNRVFHFAGCASPFENDGVAQAIVYRYKFKKVYSASVFLAREMAKMVKTAYHDLDFDGIAYVPMHPIKKLKRGFNQSEELAKQLSKLLNIQLYDRLLSCDYRKTSQHDMDVKERFKNVKGMYKTNYKVTGKTILLVDDIKTTGASFDECAKQLLIAGADNVYCISAVGSKSKKGSK